MSVSPVSGKIERFELEIGESPIHIDPQCYSSFRLVSLSSVEVWDEMFRSAEHPASPPAYGDWLKIKFKHWELTKNRSKIFRTRFSIRTTGEVFVSTDTEYDSISTLFEGERGKRVRCAPDLVHSEE